MRKLVIIVCALTAYACATEVPQDGAGGNQRQAVVVGSAQGALAGRIAVQLTPEAAAVVVAEQARNGTRAVATRSGMAGIDEVLERIGARNFTRIFDYSEDFEELYAETGISRWYDICFDEQTPMEELVRELAAQSGVAVVEYVRKPGGIRPMSEGPVVPFAAGQAAVSSTRAAAAMNDPLLSSQWHYDNTGKLSGEAGHNSVAGADIDLLDAWSLCTGDSRVIVAVIDQPVQTTHPDLQANIWTNPQNSSEHGFNFWQNKAELDWKYSYYDNGWVYLDHGTHVAGVIAAVNDNNRGVCGIAGGKNGNGVRIMSCQIMGDETISGSPYADASAFTYALANGALIAQNSWGYDYSLSEERWNNTSFSMLRNAIDTFIKGAGTKSSGSPLKGGLVFFAAGNGGGGYGDQKMWPGAYGPVIAVASIGWDYRPAYYTDYGAWVDITAPGGDAQDGTKAMVLSTILCDDTIDYEDGRKRSGLYGYGYMQGTSMACPHVAGVAALGLSYAAQLGKQYTADEFKALLLSSVYGIDSHFTGTKLSLDKNDKPITVSMSNYIGKMGGGGIDALKLLLAIKGTPALYVKTGEVATLDFAQFFGGSDSKVELLSVSMSASDLSKLGLSALPAISGTRLGLNCPNVGLATLVVRAQAGDTVISREFAIVSRPSLAQNGGWL